MAAAMEASADNFPRERTEFVKKEGRGDDWLRWGGFKRSALRDHEIWRRRHTSLDLAAMSRDAFRSLLDQGAQLAFGSDWTVAPLSPLDGIYAAVTRRTLDGKNPGGWVPEQKITVEEALRAYTAGGARAGFQEDRLGILETGRLADFVVLSQDLFRIDPNEIRDVRVLRTVIGGREVYDAGSHR
jgi:predicted amidohydrolase YtcJ